MSLHDAWTGTSGDVWLGGVGKFGLVKELNSVTNRYVTNFSVIENLPRDLLKPRGSYERKRRHFITIFQNTLH